MFSLEGMEDGPKEDADNLCAGEKAPDRDGSAPFLAAFSLVIFGA